MIFKKAVKIKKINIFSFIQYFDKSQVRRELYKYNEAIISQGELYIIGLLMEEFPELANCTSPDYDDVIAEWLGYIYGYLMVEKMSDSLLIKIDWERLYQMYDTLHTQSCEYVKSYILTEKIIKNS
jgi:hypothetical protein